jgi:hypothetical protein
VGAMPPSTSTLTKLSPTFSGESHSHTRRLGLSIFEASTRGQRVNKRAGVACEWGKMTWTMKGLVWLPCQVGWETGK